MGQFSDRRTTQGKCVKCRLRFEWATGAKRRLYHARCPHCLTRLEQTTSKLRFNVSKSTPLFYQED